LIPTIVAAGRFFVVRKLFLLDSVGADQWIGNAVDGLDQSLGRHQLAPLRFVVEYPVSTLRATAMPIADWLTVGY
jgi:hypothetical protein